MLAGRRFFVPLLLLIAGAAAAGCAVGAGDIPDSSLGLPPSGDATLEGSSDATRPPGRDSTVDLDAGMDSGQPSLSDADADAGTAPEAGSNEAGGVDGGGSDATPPADTGCDLANGFHLCGSTCTPNGANNPSTGCSQGCNDAPCVAASGETASCTDAGTCSSGCGSGLKMCSGGTCAACCGDTDCPTNVMCVGGTCSGCAPAFGTCVTLCDTNLTTDNNCGFCGNQCPSGFLAGCGFAGCCSCTCQGSGAFQNWSCQ